MRLIGAPEKRARNAASSRAARSARGGAARSLRAASFASRDPLPAGGAAAVLAVTVGVGLALKVITITGGQGALAQARDELPRLLEQLQPEFAADCAAFAGLMDALRLPPTEPSRAGRVRAGWLAATAAPVSVAVRAYEAEKLIASCRGLVKATVKADLEAAIDLVRTGRAIAERNARENAERLDPSVARELLGQLGAGSLDE